MEWRYGVLSWYGKRNKHRKGYKAAEVDLLQGLPNQQQFLTTS